MNNHIQPADRLSLVSEYYFSRKLKEVADMRAAGKDIVSLAIGSPDMPPSAQTIDTLRREIMNPEAHGYVPTKGTQELRTAFAHFYRKWFHVELDPNSEIQPLIGSKEGILHVTLAFVNPGDEVLIPDPGYPTYTALSTLLGAKVVKYNLTEKNGWMPNFDELEAMDLSRVKLMWTNYPHMPTGAKASAALYERLVDFARRKGLVIVNDNPYSFIFNKEQLSILQVEGAKDCCIEFNSMSKSHNMPGWRVGMMASNAEFISWTLKVKSNIDNGTLRPLQLAAAKALHNEETWHHQYNYEVYAQRRKLAERMMDTLHCTYDPQSAGMFLWGRIPEKYPTAEALTERLLHEAGVFVTPGFIFGRNGERYIRISLCANEEAMNEALRRIENFAKNN